MESNRVDSGARDDPLKTPDLESTPGGFPISPVASTSLPDRTSHDGPDSPVDPDAFYRSFEHAPAPPPAASNSSNTTAFADAHSPPRAQNTTTQSRVPRTSNFSSSLPKPATTSTSGPYNFRANLRSVTNPSPGLPSGGANPKLRSVSTTDPTDQHNRPSNLSVVDRARQFEQNRPTPALAPAPSLGGKSLPSERQDLSAQSKVEEKQAAGKLPSLQRRTPGASPTATRKVATKASPDDPYAADPSLSTPSRQPLFGEVITVTNGGVGHGIPTNYAKKSASESNIQSPTASPQSARSRSRMDAQLQKATTAGASKTSNAYRRTSHDSSERRRDAASDDSASNAQLPASTYNQSHRSPPNRQLVRPRGYSASSEGLSSPGGRDIAGGSLPRPTTPQSSSSARRYVRSPDRPAASGHTVNAVIKALPETTIPAPSLRSSRPRVPLSAASTASSRAKQSGRSSSKSSQTSSPPATPVVSPASRGRKPRSAGMLRAAEQARQKSRSRTRRPNYAATDSESSQELRRDHKSSKDAADGDIYRTDLKVDTTHKKRATDELDSALTDMEVDDSPILGRTIYQPIGQRHDRNTANDASDSNDTNDAPASENKLIPHRLSTIEASPDPNELIHANFDVSPGAEQPPTPFEPPQEVVEAFSSAGGDEGTIRVQLRGTPVMDATSWLAVTPEGATTPVEGGMRDSGIGSADADQQKLQLVDRFHSPDVFMLEVDSPQTDVLAWNKHAGSRPPSRPPTKPLPPLPTTRKPERPALPKLTTQGLYPSIIDSNSGLFNVRLDLALAQSLRVGGVGGFAPPGRNVQFSDRNRPGTPHYASESPGITDSSTSWPAVPPVVSLAGFHGRSPQGEVRALTPEKRDSFDALDDKPYAGKDDIYRSAPPYGQPTSAPSRPGLLDVVRSSVVGGKKRSERRRVGRQQATPLSTIAELPEPINRPPPQAPRPRIRSRVLSGSNLLPLLLSSPKLTRNEEADKRSRRSSSLTPTKAAYLTAKPPSNHRPYDTPPEGDNFSPGSAKIIVGPEVPPKHSPLVSAPLHSKSHSGDNSRTGRTRTLPGGQEIIPLRLGASQATNSADPGDNKSPQLPDIPGIGTGLGLLEPTTPRLPTHPPPPVPATDHAGPDSATRPVSHPHPPPTSTPAAPADSEMEYLRAAGALAWQAGGAAINAGQNALYCLPGGDYASRAMALALQNASAVSLPNRVVPLNREVEDGNPTPRVQHQPETTRLIKFAASPATHIRPSSSKDAPESVEWDRSELTEVFRKYQALAVEDPDRFRAMVDRAKREAAELDSSGYEVIAPPAEDMALLEKTAEANLKRIHKIRHIIRELAVTEEKYRNDLDTVFILYMRTATAVGLSQDDINIIFGPWEDLVNFAARFKGPLQHATKPLYHKKDADDQDCFPIGWEDLTLWDKSVREAQLTVGACFLEWATEMSEIFGSYIYNQSASSKRLEKVKEDPKVEDWLEIAADHHKDISGAWDLPSLLVKPLQRLTKYPLLLKSLIDELYDDHPDYQNLVQAHEKLTGEITYINRRKARIDVVNKVRNGEPFTPAKVEDKKPAASLITSLTGLNIPGLKMFKSKDDKDKKKKKAKAKMPDKVKARQLRIRAKYEDPAYEGLENEFMAHLLQIQIVMADIAHYTKEIKHCAKWFQELGDTLTTLIDTKLVHEYDLTQVSKWVLLARAAKDFATHGIEEHAHDTYRQIVAPLKYLMTLHEDPRNLILARKNYATVFKEYLEVQEDMRDDPSVVMPEELLDTKERYEALTETLKDDLPKLYQLTNKAVNIIATKFMLTEADWYKAWIQKFAPIVEMGLDPGRDPATILPRLNSHNILMAFRNDFGPAYAAAQELSICNGTLRQAYSGKSPLVEETRSETTLPSPSTSRRHSGQPTVASPPPTAYPTPAEQYAAAPSRSRVNLAGWKMTPAGPTNDEQLLASLAATHARRAELRKQARRLLFSSSMPMGEEEKPEEREEDDDDDDDDDEEEVMFVAASLFDFHIERAREEAGYPYLSYQPGEIFNVFGVKGELWLAANQDDQEGRVGWVWDKHFSKISNAVSR